MPEETASQIKIAKPKRKVRRKKTAKKAAKKSKKRKSSFAFANLFARLPKLNMPSSKNLIIAGVAILILALGYSQYRLHAIAAANDQGNAVEEKTKNILRDVGAVMELPEGETPQIAVVQDADKMRASQPFFKRAVNGDEVQMYTDMVILYSPTEHKIVNVTPIDTATAAETATSTTATTTLQTASSTQSTKKTDTATTSSTTQPIKK